MKLAKPILLIILCTIFTAIGQLLMKLGLNNLKLSFIGVITDYQLIIGLFLYLAGAVIMVYALKQAEFSVLYPFFSLSFVWVALLSVIVLKESLVLLQGLGILTILLGVSFVGRGASHD